MSGNRCGARRAWRCSGGTANCSATRLIVSMKPGPKPVRTRLWEAGLSLDAFALAGARLLLGLKARALAARAFFAFPADLRAPVDLFFTRYRFPLLLSPPPLDPNGR